MMPGTVMYVYPRLAGQSRPAIAAHDGEWSFTASASWPRHSHDIVTRLGEGLGQEDSAATQTERNPKDMMSAPRLLSSVKPADAHNARLVSYGHPPDGRINPSSLLQSRRHRRGTGGLYAAARSRFGAKVALVEKSLLGETVFNVGCVPSQSYHPLLRAPF